MYDEFGNYIGPELDSDEEDEHEPLSPEDADVEEDEEDNENDEQQGNLCRTWSSNTLTCCSSFISCNWSS